jgi:tetratricopeptide (TPR) repeat protein
VERDRAPLDAPDAEELRAAEALGAALEGRSVSPDLPEQALETAALLRFSGAQGELGAERRAEIREALLASLPARAPARRRRFSFLMLWLPAALGAGLAVVFASRALFRSTESSPGAVSQTEEATPAGAVASAPQSLAKAEGAVSRGAAEATGEAQGGARVMELGAAELAQLTAATQGYRQERITPLVDESVTRIHAEIDRADSAAELDRLGQSALQSGPAASGRSSGRALADARQPDIVRQDLYCRLAEAALRLGQPEQALEWAKRGIDLDGPPNPLLAQLMAIDGQARSSLGDRLGAAKSYLRALDINEALLDEHLDGP